MVLDIAKVRAQFPALALTDRGGPRVYFDNPAGTQVPQIVVDRMVSALIDSNANMNGNFRTSREATEISRQAPGDGRLFQCEVGKRSDFWTEYDVIDIHDGARFGIAVFAW